MRHEIFGHMDPSAIARVPATVDKKDAHVASAALMLARSAEAGVDRVFLVTANLEDLPPGELAIQGVVTLSPGAFVDALHAADPERVQRALTRTLADLKNPPYTAAELLAACRAEFLAAQAQPLHERGAAVGAQALRVGHRDQEQVQRRSACVAAIDQVALHQGLINPAELLGHLAQALRQQQSLDCLHRAPG